MSHKPSKKKGVQTTVASTDDNYVDDTSEAATAAAAAAAADDAAAAAAAAGGEDAAAAAADVAPAGAAPYQAPRFPAPEFTLLTELRLARKINLPTGLLARVTNNWTYDGLHTSVTTIDKDATARALVHSKSAQVTCQFPQERPQPGKLSEHVALVKESIKMRDVIFLWHVYNSLLDASEDDKIEWFGSHNDALELVTESVRDALNVTLKDEMIALNQKRLALSVPSALQPAMADMQVPHHVVNDTRVTERLAAARQIHKNLNFNEKRSAPAPGGAAKRSRSSSRSRSRRGRSSSSSRSGSYTSNNNNNNNNNNNYNNSNNSNFDDSHDDFNFFQHSTRGGARGAFRGGRARGRGRR